MPLIGDLSGSLGKNSLIGVTGSIDISYDGEGTEDGWIQFQEMTGDPSTPAANHGKVYAKDTGGVTIPYFIDASGTVTSLLGGSGGGGSPGGSDGQVQYNNGSSFGGASGLVYDDSNNRVGIGTSPSTTLHVLAEASSAYVTTIDNDASSAGHGLKVTSDGTGSGTNIFDAESASTTLFRIRGDGRVGIGKVSSLPAAKLTVSSSNSDSDLAIAHKIHHIGDSDTAISFDTDEISFTSGGSTELQVGDSAIHVKQYIRHIGDTNTHINFTDDKIILKAGNLSMVTMEEKDSAPHEVRINNGGNNIDFVVEDNSGNTTLMTDASTSRVGIGTDAPDYELDVAGNIGVDEYIYHNGDDDTRIKFEDDVITLTAGTAASIQLREASYDHIMINSSMNDVDTYIYGQNMNRTLFKGIAQQNNEQVLILSGGAVGSIDTASGDDVAFFVSGSVGVKDSGTKGASVFGGDLITSGTSWHMNNLVVEDIDANEQGIITIGDTTASAYTTITTSQYGRVTVQSRRNGRDGEIWLDSADDIILDVESGGTLEMREASVSLLKITPNSSNIDIQPQVANKDIRIASQSGNTLLTADSSDEAIKIDRKLGLGMTTLMATGTLSADHPVVMIANAGSSDVTGTLSDPTFSGQMKVVVGMKMSSGECILSYKNPAGTTTNKTLINGVGVLLCGFEMTPGSYRWFTVGDVT